MPGDELPFPIAVPVVGGPQDGAKIRMYTTDIKPRVWVGPKWMGDGFSAFSSGGPSDRFPIELTFRAGAYRFTRDTR